MRSCTRPERIQIDSDESCPVWYLAERSTAATAMRPPVLTVHVAKAGLHCWQESAEPGGRKHSRRRRRHGSGGDNAEPSDGKRHCRHGSTAASQRPRHGESSGGHPAANSRHLSESQFAADRQVKAELQPDASRQKRGRQREASDGGGSSCDAAAGAGCSGRGDSGPGRGHSEYPGSGGSGAGDADPAAAGVRKRGRGHADAGGGGLRMFRSAAMAADDAATLRERRGGRKQEGGGSGRAEAENSKGSMSNLEQLRRQALASHRL